MIEAAGAHRLLHRAAAFASAIAFALVTQASAKAQHGATTTLRATGRNVILDIVVTDSRGRPVAGLSAGDLVVMENGEAQTVHIASASTGTGRGAGQRGTRSGNAFPSEIRPHGTQVPERLALADGARTVILLDEVNVQFMDLAFARQRLEVFLRGPAAQGQEIAILAMTARQEVLVHDFTTDTSALIDSVHRLPGVLTATGSGGIINGNVDPANDTENLRKAMGALEQLARAFSGSGERVNVIWITSGFLTLAQLFTSGDFQVTQNELLKRATNLFLSARMCLYTIDPHGVQIESSLPNHNGQRSVYGPASAQALFAANTGGEFAGQTMNMTNNQAVANSFLGALDRKSGGRAFGNGNDIDVALGRVLEESDAALRIAYSPTNKSFDGSYRKISVTVKRPGLTARAREGYYALPEPPEPTVSQQRSHLESAIESPFAYQALQVSGELQTSPAPTVSVHVAARQLRWRYGSEGAHVDQILVLAAFSAENRPLGSKSFEVSAKERSVSSSSTSVSYRVPFPVPPGTARLRVAVSDRGSDQIGTADVAMTGTGTNAEEKPVCRDH